MASVVSFGQLPEEEREFLAFVVKTGDVWARAVNDDPEMPRYEPRPVAEFLTRFAREITAYSVVSVYLGLHEDIIEPVSRIHEVTEGGTKEPFIQNGRVVDGVHTIVGGTKVQRKTVDSQASRLVRYDRGEFRNDEELAASNLCFYPGAYINNAWTTHPTCFTKWGKKLLAWMRRHTPESVRVYQCNYEMRATVRVAEACKKGLKLR